MMLKKKGGNLLNPDRNTVNKLLSLNDSELEAMIRKICAENGIDAKSLGLGPESIGMLRAVLSNANERDIQNFLSVLSRRKGGKK